MPWRRETVMDQRIEFVVRLGRKTESMSSLCQEFGISRPTGYLWWRRYQDAGSVTGLEERSRRPERSPRRTGDEVESEIVKLREQYGWGARKIGWMLEQRGKKVPAITIHRILVRQGLVVEAGTTRQATRRFERAECNEMAQMDFKGDYGVKEGKCYPLSFLDDHSRYLIGLWPLSSTNGEGVHQSLRGKFRETGVPHSILLDHGTPWYSGTNGHGLTWVSVWMLKQGIRLIFAGFRHPETSGKVERFHRTLKARTKHRGMPKTIEEWKGWAEEFRQEYNETRPHEAIGMRPPAEVYTEANLRPYRENPREWEYSGGSVLQLNSRGNLYYRGRQYFVCEALAGELVRVDELDELLLVTFRQTTVREIDLRTGKTVAVIMESPWLG